MRMVVSFCLLVAGSRQETPRAIRHSQACSAHTDTQHHGVMRRVTSEAGGVRRSI